MTDADLYRKIAADLTAKAAKEKHAVIAAEWDRLARCYARLAEQAELNRFQDLWLEFGPEPRLDNRDAR